MRNLLKTVMAVMLVCSTCTATAGDYAKFYQNLPVELRKAVQPSIPDKAVNVENYGAVGDGVTLCTEAFARAIDELSAQGGGRVVVPQGVWLTGPIELRDNIELRVEKNAIIYFSPDKSLYNIATGSSRVKACISAQRCKNIAITGEGIIDGNGAQWRPVKRSKVSDVEWKRFKQMGGVERQEGSLWYPWELKNGSPNLGETPEAQEKRRNDLFRVNNCENILLKGVTFQNAPKFHVHPINCRNIIIDGITVRCPWNAQNGDAIDLSDCHQALIVNCTVDAGDDGLCMKSGEYKENALVNGCEDILIEGNKVYHAHGGFVIGSESVCGMRRIVVRDCSFAGTDTGLRFKSGIGRGGKTEDIYIDGIVMTDIVQEAIIFQCDYANKPAGAKNDRPIVPVRVDKVPEFTDIHISDVTCRSASTSISAHGIEGMKCVYGITIDNSTFVYRKDVHDIDTETTELRLSDIKFVEDKRD